MKKLLVVVDMQNDFITGSLGTKEAEGIVNVVCDKITSWSGDIIFTQDTHEENYLETLEGTKLPVKHCIEGTDGWNICDKVEAALDTVRKRNNQAVIGVLKNTFGSFNLAKIAMDRILSDLNKKPWDEIELCGLCTDICVINNALILRAKFPNVPITIRKDLCAGVTVEKHNAALEVLKSCQIDVI